MTVVEFKKGRRKWRGEDTEKLIKAWNAGFAGTVGAFDERLATKLDVSTETVAQHRRQLGFVVNPGAALIEKRQEQSNNSKLKSVSEKQLNESAAKEMRKLKPPHEDTMTWIKKRKNEIGGAAWM